MLNRVQQQQLHAYGKGKSKPKPGRWTNEDKLAALKYVYDNKLHTSPEYKEKIYEQLADHLHRNHFSSLNADKNRLRVGGQGTRKKYMQTLKEVSIKYAIDAPGYSFCHCRRNTM